MKIPTSTVGKVGMAMQDEQLFLSFHSVDGHRSTIHLTEVSIRASEN